MTTEAHAQHPNYVKIWAILVVLLIVSVIGSMSHIREVVLVAAFGVALVKAFLVAKNFMHINVEKRWVPYLLILCVVFIVILFAGVSGLLDDVEVSDLRAFEDGFYPYLESSAASVLTDIATKKALDDDIKARLTAAVKDYKESFLAGLKEQAAAKKAATAAAGN